jgi:hypothetical protein
MKAKIKGTMLFISLELQEPKLSASKKSMTIATSNGCKKSGETYRGKDIYVIANAIVFKKPKRKPAKRLVK